MVKRCLLFLQQNWRQEKSHNPMFGHLFSDLVQPRFMYALYRYIRILICYVYTFAKRDVDIYLDLQSPNVCWTIIIRQFVVRSQKASKARDVGYRSALQYDRQHCQTPYGDLNYRSLDCETSRDLSIDVLLFIETDPCKPSRYKYAVLPV